MMICFLNFSVMYLFVQVNYIFAIIEKENVHVFAPVGPIKGSLMKSRLGKKIYAFRGVPYAEPPVGQQRFQPPIPVKKWTDVFDASEEGPSCVSPGNKNISEDCLRLNIYTTKLLSNQSGDEKIVKRPVIVFFHAGGYYGRSGQSFSLGPQYMMDQNVILVTTNYRLASLGFMSTGDSLLPGNLGLKDQVQALRWIQENIAAFGGDPGSVTITGCSAGSWSVSLHLVSPMTKGLFHRVIAMSGSATYQNLLPTAQKHLAKKQAELLRCPTDTVGNMIICLNTKSIEEFANTTYKFFEWHGNPIFVWLPVVEPEVNGVERFLTAQPIDLIRQGKFHKVPVITGITKDEFGAFLVKAIERVKRGNDSILQTINQNWTTLAPVIFMYERNTDHSLYISKELKKFYLNDKPVSLQNFDDLGKLYSDSVIGFSTHRFVNLLANVSSEPVYYYRFAYQGRYSHATWSNSTPYGVAHHDDLLYLFYVSSFPYFDMDAPEIPTVERMTTIWAHFAATGEPFPKNDLFQGIVWEKFTSQDQLYLDIDKKLTMKTKLYKERMDFWDKLFSLPPLSSS